MLPAKMLRSNFKWLITNRSTRNVALRLFCTRDSEPTTYKRKSGNEITLIGTVRNDVKNLINGFDSFELATANKSTKSTDEFFTVTHKIKVKNDVIETPKLIDNDLVYIHGEIGYQRVSDGDKAVSVPNIFAKQILRLENFHRSNDLEMLEKDSVNEVKLTGAIGGDIADMEYSTVFSIYTYNDLISIVKPDIFHADWHRILIVDENLRHFVRTSLKRSDPVLINGKIIYKKHELQNGNIRRVGSILARRIQKLEQFKQDRAQDEVEQ